MPDKHNRPNILISGTPGTGKTTLATQLVEKLELEHLNVGNIAEDNNCYEGFDENYQCKVLDEEKLLDALEERLNGEEGGVVLDYHGSDFFPQRWFDAVFVLRTDNTRLYDRLSHRNYNEKKLRENVECEIFGTLLEEAKESYPSDIVHELSSNTPEDMETNVDRICQWVSQWISDHNQNT